MADDPKERRADYILLGKMKGHIETMAKEIPKIREDVSTLKSEVSALNVKAGWTGAFAGALMSLPIYIKYFFIKGGQ